MNTLNQLPAFLGPLSAVFSSLTWAIGVSVYSGLTSRQPAYAVNFSRAITAFPIFVLLVFSGGFHSGFDLFKGAHAFNVLWLAFSIVGSYGLGDALFLISSRRLGVPAALAIGSSYPVWSALAGWWLRGETLILHQAVGLLVVVGGVVVVVLSGAPASEREKTGGYRTGVILAFLVSFLWALNTFAVAKGGEGLSAGVVNVIRMGAALLLCPIIGFFFVGRIRSPLIPLGDYKKALWVFVVEGFGGSVFYVYALTHASLAVAAALTSLAPALSVPIAFAFKTEWVSKVKMLGILLVVAGIWALVTP